MSEQLIIRPANPEDRPVLSAELDHADHVFYHLDWSSPLDWIGKQPFWVVEDSRGICAALALIEEPAGIAWLRMYACRRGVSPQEHWETLMSKCLAHFNPQNMPTIAALGLKEWMIPLLTGVGFLYHQSIVTLYRELNDRGEDDLPIPPSVFIRPMEEEDLPRVAAIDQQAFEPIWQNSLPQIKISFQRARYATVAEVDGQVVGFQISTSNLFSVHLARLAVLPSHTRQRIGFALVADLIQRCKRDGCWELSVNTQNDNHASLSLYQKIGFKRSDQSFSVWTYYAD
ncbi:MAG: GNAT family N-acetyltransferase [Chloroflexota bacterium]|jgi:ribosomal protein S18 acetylase RimI-like enzyme